MTDKHVTPHEELGGEVIKIIDLDEVQSEIADGITFVEQLKAVLKAVIDVDSALEEVTENELNFHDFILGLKRDGCVFVEAVEIEAEMSGLRDEILLHLERMVGNFPVFK